MNIYIKPTEKCNLKCRHCYNGEPCSDKLDIEAAAQFSSSLFFLNKEEENWLILHGGEPLMASIDQLEQMSNLNIPGVHKRITTNLVAPLSKAAMNLLMSMDDIRTSFDVGLGRFVKLKHFIWWVHNIRWCRSNGLPLSTLNVCLSSGMIKVKPVKLVRMAKQLGFKKLSFENLCLSGRLDESKKELVPPPAAVDEWLLELYHSDHTEIEIMNFTSLRAGLYNDWKNYRGIECCKRTLTINANGTVGECPNSARNNVIGSISDDVSNILKGHVCTLHKNEHFKTCLTCSYFKYCRGGCKEQSWIDGVCSYPKKTADAIRRDISKNESV